MWDVFGALFHNSVGVTRARQNPCLLAQGKWILVQGKEAEVDPDTIKMYTILVTSQFHISSLSEDSYLLSFTIRENGIQKKEIQASKNKLRANGPKPQLAPGTSSAFLFSSCPGDLHVVSIKMACWVCSIEVQSHTTLYDFLVSCSHWWLCTTSTRFHLPNTLPPPSLWQWPPRLRSTEKTIAAAVTFNVLW